MKRCPEVTHLQPALHSDFPPPGVTADVRRKRASSEQAPASEERPKAEFHPGLI